MDDMHAGSSRVRERQWFNPNFQISKETMCQNHAPMIGYRPPESVLSKKTEPNLSPSWQAGTSMQQECMLLVQSIQLFNTCKYDTLTMF